MGLSFLKENMLNIPMLTKHLLRGKHFHALYFFLMISKETFRNTKTTKLREIQFNFITDPFVLFTLFIFIHAFIVSIIYRGIC